jgi:hypothetical protein
LPSMSLVQSNHFGHYSQFASGPIARVQISGIRVAADGRQE